MKVAIFIVNWNGFEDTKACLASLAKHCKEADILLLENGSGQEALLRDILDDRTELFVSEKNLGFAGGNNLLLKEAINRGYGAVYLLNNDTVVTNNFLDEPLKLLKKKDIGFVASKILLKDTNLIDTAGHRHLNSGDIVPEGRLKKSSQYRQNRPILSGCGAGLLIKVEMLKHVGLFDSSFFLNYEDVDLTYRATAMGWRGEFCASSIIYHKLNASVSKARNDAYFIRSYRNSLHAYFGNTPLCLIIANTPWIIMKYIGVFAVGSLFFKKDLTYLCAGILKFLREINTVKRHRRRLRNKRRSSVLFIFIHQCSFLPTYMAILAKHFITVAHRFRFYSRNLKKTLNNRPLALFNSRFLNLDILLPTQLFDGIDNLRSAQHAEWMTKTRCHPLKLTLQRMHSRIHRDMPRFSIIVPCFESNDKWIKHLIESIAHQSYSRWECIFVDDGSSKRGHLRIIKSYCADDARYCLVKLTKNHGSGYASQIGFEKSKGDYCIVVDHDDLLEPNALFEIAMAAKRTSADVIYTDEVLVDSKSRVIRCEFRPDYNYHQLLSHPYIVHLTAIKSSMISKVGGYAKDLRICQDYDLLLRIAAKSRSFVHIPKVLYRWRTHPNSAGHALTKAVIKTSIKSINNHLRTIGMTEDKAWTEKGLSFNFFRVRRKITQRHISAIILTKNKHHLLKKCVESLQRAIDFAQLKSEIIIVDNGSTSSSTLKYLRRLKDQGIVILRKSEQFNYSKLNNCAARRATHSRLLFLNNDVESSNPSWLEAMLELTEFEDIGIVGSKLIYPENGLIQHAGVLVGIMGIAAHDHQFVNEQYGSHLNSGFGHKLLCIRECSAITGACMLVKKDAFKSINGFDERLEVGFGDTDLCIRIIDAGYKCVFTPYARLIHHESATRGLSVNDPHPKDSAYFYKKWVHRLKHGDPFYNANLSRYGNLYEPV